MNASGLGETNIGEYIKKKRLEKKWTQEKLAEECTVSVKTISNWENSAELIQKIENLRKLSEVLDVPLVCLTAGRDIEELDSETKRILDERINELFEKVGDMRNVTINIEDRGIVSLDLGFSALGISSIALALGTWAVSNHSIFVLILCSFLGVMGVYVLLFGRKIIKKLERELKVRKEG